MRRTSGWSVLIAYATASIGALFITLDACADVLNMPAGQTSVKFVPIGDTGNAADATGFGAVPYTYKMGQFDITAVQYTQFLNAVAKTDTYGLYNSNMAGVGTIGCGITQIGAAPNLVYTVASADVNFPVNYVSWGAAARFANWMTNGQPATGAETAATTETGSYSLNGAVSDAALQAVNRSPAAGYVVPTEDEWYKAAYYRGGPTSAGYWVYPTKSNTPPSNAASASGTNNANYFLANYTDPANHLTPVGSFANSPSSYGTYDQGGDVFQWNEVNINGTSRGIRGGSFDDFASSLASSDRSGADAADGFYNLGFRIAQVPEPASFWIVGIGALHLLGRRRKI